MPFLTSYLQLALAHARNSRVKKGVEKHFQLFKKHYTSLDLIVFTRKTIIMKSYKINDYGNAKEDILTSLAVFGNLICNKINFRRKVNHVQFK